MLKLTVVFFSMFIGAATAVADFSNGASGARSCGLTNAQVQRSIEMSMSVHKDVVASRMVLAGYKGENLSNILEVSVQCSDSTKNYFKRTDRVLIQAYFRVKLSICRFQFSNDINQTENSLFDFDYLHCEFVRQ